MIIISLLVILTIFINLGVLYLIKTKEINNCDCSKISIFKKNYIKYYSLVSLLLVTIIYILPILLIIIRLKNIGYLYTAFLKSNPVQLITSIFLALGFFNIYFIFRYTKDLEKSKCNCETKEEETLRKTLNYYALVVITIYIITSIAAFSIKVN